LWDRIVAQITPPPARDDMVNGFLDLYRSAAITQKEGMMGDAA
jgi:hypothetical protein